MADISWIASRSLAMTVARGVPLADTLHLAMTDGGPRGSCLAFVVPKKCAPGGARSGWEASLRGEEWFLHGKNEKRR